MNKEFELLKAIKIQHSLTRITVVGMVLMGVGSILVQLKGYLIASIPFSLGIVTLLVLMFEQANYNKQEVKLL